MAEPLLPQDRLQPALLDRLTDDEPDKKQEPREARVLSKSRMRQSVLRDLAWLFNATRLEAVADLAKLPYVRRSVLNFGLPALSGRTASSLDVTDLDPRRPRSHPDLRAAHPAGDAADQDVARGR